MKDKKILILSSGGEPLHFIYNAIKESYPSLKVIIEEKESKRTFLKRRVKKLGYLEVLGQVLFMLIIPRLLSIGSAKRIKNIKESYSLNSTSIAEKNILQVDSINSKSAIAFIKSEEPDLIIVNGTRIISKKVLKSTEAPFINIHIGITPKYRGVHGGYWSLAEDDQAHFGVTVHKVDAGIDTGSVLAQKVISVSPSDNYITYPYLQNGEGIRLLSLCIETYFSDGLKEMAAITDQNSLWYHPTLWGYISTRIRKGIK